MFWITYVARRYDLFMGVEFRALNFSDEAEVRFIAERDILIPALFDPDVVVDPVMVENHVRYFSKFSADDFAYVALDGGRVVGYHIVKKDMFFGRPVGNVYTLWVDPEFRRQGIARRLKEFADQWAKQVGLFCLYTFTFVANTPTVNLNRDMGFEIISYRMQKKF
jgi:GNAT superfamily N-acetyltransferase